MNEGIDAVIVDSVLAIRKGLTTHSGKEEAPKDMEKTAIDEGQELQKRISIASG